MHPLEPCSPLNLSQKSYSPSVPTPRSNASCIQQSPVSFTSLLTACEGPPTYVDTPAPSLTWPWHTPATSQQLVPSVATPQDGTAAIRRPVQPVGMTQQQGVSASAEWQRAAASRSTTLQQQMATTPNHTATIAQPKRVSAPLWNVPLATAVQQQVTSPSTPQQQQPTLASKAVSQQQQQQQSVPATSSYQWHVPDDTPRPQSLAAATPPVPQGERIVITTANQPHESATAKQLVATGTASKPHFAAPPKHQTPAETRFDGSPRTIVTPGLHTPVAVSPGLHTPLASALYTPMTTTRQIPIGAVSYTPLPPLVNSPLTNSPMPSAPLTNTPLPISALGCSPMSGSPLASPHQFLPPTRQLCFTPHPAKVCQYVSIAS